MSERKRNKEGGSDSELGVSWKHLDLKRFFFFSAVVHVANDLTFYPFELMRVKLQVAKDKGSMKMWSGMVDAMKQTIAKHGIMGMFRHSTVSVFGRLPSEMYYIGAYKFFSDKLQDINDRYTGKVTRGSSVWVTLGASGLADATSGLLFVPVDIAAQRLQAGDKRYRNGRDALRKIYAAEGIRGLYRGLGASLAYSVPQSMVWWTSYEGMKWLMVDFGPGPSLLQFPKEWAATNSVAAFWNSQDRVAQIGGGFISGVITTLVMNPIEVVKTRIQTEKKEIQEPFWELCRTMLRKEGPATFFRGILPKTLYFASVSAISCVNYEIVMLLSRKKPSEHRWTEEYLAGTF